jgi:hypothetical protein
VRQLVAASDRDWAKSKKKLGGEGSPDEAVDPVAKYLTLLKEYQNYVFGVLFLTLAVGILWVSYRERAQQREDQAWIDLGHERNPTVEKLAQLDEKYDGTSAQPFIQLQYADKLYERGTHDDLALAQKILSRTIEIARGNEIVVDLARTKLHGIERELGDKALWDAAKGSTAPVPSSAPPK